MKKLISMLLALTMMLSLCGCQLLCNHNWNEATCTTPRTCSKCGKVEGEPLGHSGNDFTLIETDYLTATDKYILKCDLCGEVLEDKEEPSTTFIKDGCFGFTCKEFVERLQIIWDENYGIDPNLENTLNFNYEIYSNGFIVGNIYLNDNVIAFCLFSDSNGTYFTEENEDDRTISKMVVYTLLEDIDVEEGFTLHKLFADIVSMTVDPAIKNSKFIDSICSSTYKRGEKSLHNIYYSSGYEPNESFSLYVEIDEAAYSVK